MWISAVRVNGARNRLISCKLHANGEHSISELAELFSISRPSIYRALASRVHGEHGGCV
jgi:DeoR/GlpR family transcriptional regulator of sugar metabolism